MASWATTWGRGQPFSAASSSKRRTPKTWSMWPWEYTAVCRGAPDQPRSSLWTWRAMNALPVSTSASPSSVAKALTLAREATKATPSATSASPPSGVIGWCSCTSVSPRHNRSARSSTSIATGANGSAGPCGRAGRRVESYRSHGGRQAPRRVEVVGRRPGRRGPGRRPPRRRHLRGRARFAACGGEDAGPTPVQGGTATGRAHGAQREPGVRSHRRRLRHPRRRRHPRRDLPPGHLLPLPGGHLQRGPDLRDLRPRPAEAGHPIGRGVPHRPPRHARAPSGRPLQRPAARPADPRALVRRPPGNRGHRLRAHRRRPGGRGADPPPSPAGGHVTGAAAGALTALFRSPGGPPLPPLAPPLPLRGWAGRLHLHGGGDGVVGRGRSGRLPAGQCGLHGRAQALGAGLVHLVGPVGELGEHLAGEELDRLADVVVAVAPGLGDEDERGHPGRLVAADEVADLLRGADGTAQGAEPLLEELGAELLTRLGGHVAVEAE